MAFISDIQQFLTPAALAAHLDTLPRPDWPGEGNPRGSCFHNTYRPTAAQWRGRPTMDGMISTYIGKGWSSGPHYYLCLGAPNPKTDGIWQMTPPTMPGTHAGDCNGHLFGIEVVGDFQTSPPSLPLQLLLINTLVVLHRWAGLGVDLAAHRDCMPGRTCPGNAFYALKGTIEARLSARLNQAGTYRALAPMWVSETPTARGPIALRGAATVRAGEQIDVDEVKNDYAHLTNGVGFLPVGGLEKL
jgi:hypothetical protein